MNEINLNNISIIKSSLKNGQNEKILNTSSTNKHVSILSPSSNGNITNENRKAKSATRTLKKSSSQNEPIGKAPFYPASTQLSQTSKSFKKTIAENSLVSFDNEKKFLFSTWTPLSDEKSNQRVNLFYFFIKFLILKFLIPFFAMLKVIRRKKTAGNQMV
jgi:hypothetical protein